MPQVIAVDFDNHGTWHYLRCPRGFSPEVGDQVLYPTESGDEVARVVWTGQAPVGSLPACPGFAETPDLERDRQCRVKRAEIERVAQQLIRDHHLPMHIVSVDYHHPAVSPELAVVYYKAPHRVDFRALVSDLAAALGCRVDLRQLAMRDVACMLKTAGLCGRPTCCSTWMSELRPVKCRRQAAKGVCGRTVCCANFEG